MWHTVSVLPLKGEITDYPRNGMVSLSRVGRTLRVSRGGSPGTARPTMRFFKVTVELP